MDWLVLALIVLFVLGSGSSSKSSSANDGRDDALIETQRLDDISDSMDRADMCGDHHHCTHV